MQNIKSAIRTALISKGISASTHNMEDFATDISSINVGTDVSDTTATESDVVSGKYFYKSDGTRKSGSIIMNALTPSSDGQNITANTVYRASASGYAINNYENIIPSASGTEFSSGFNKMSSSGYAYSEKPSGGNIIKVSRSGTNTVTTVEEIPVDANYVTVNSWMGTYKWFHFMASATDNTVIFYWRTSSSTQSASKIGYRNSTAIGNTNPLNIKTVDGKEVWQIWTGYDGEYEVAWG